MSEHSPAGSSEGPDGLEIFDADVGVEGARLVCRVCGALVPRDGGYAQVHWAWHEAANGA